VWVGWGGEGGELPCSQELAGKEKYTINGKGKAGLGWVEGGMQKYYIGNLHLLSPWGKGTWKEGEDTGTFRIGWGVKTKK